MRRGGRRRLGFEVGVWGGFDGDGCFWGVGLRCVGKVKGEGEREEGAEEMRFAKRKSGLERER